MMSTGRNLSPKPTPGRRRWLFFLTGWTVFALVAVWWLWRRAGRPVISTSWSLGGNATAEATPLEHLANWFRLADLNFHRIYPWILLAPYVVVLGNSPGDRANGA
jgi:hypothetical protein